VPRPEPWNIADLLDYEFLLDAESRADENTLAERDKAVREEQAALLSSGGPPDRRTLFKRWVQARRRGDDTLPGAYFLGGWHTLLWLAAVAGLLVGTSLAGGLLHYRGEEPVNVAWFFASTVGVQLLLLSLATVVWLGRKLIGASHAVAPLLWLLSGLTWALSAGVRRLPGESRERIRASWAVLRHKEGAYRPLTVWPFLIATQLFGVCFNLAVIATLLLSVSLSDVAFGWQSTLHTSARDAYQIVKTVALPWSFAPNAHPTLTEVEASRFAYSEGIRPLSREALAAWWPWLCYSVVTYGLLVRSALLVWSSLSLRAATRRVTFDSQAGNALWRRLAGPVIQAQSGTAVLDLPAHVETPRSHAMGSSLVMLSTDVTLEESKIVDSLRAQYGWEVNKLLPVQIDHPSGNAEALAAITELAPHVASIVVVARSRRPPIKAIALLLKKVAAAAAGSKAELIILLIGRDESGGFAAVEEEHFGHWQNFNAIHELHFGLEKWRQS
jgi:hypothetical protein